MSEIRGSWEERLESAQVAAEGNDTQTDALFGDLIARLSRLSEKMLLAGDGHLLNLRNVAVGRYASWLADSGRYEDALALLEQQNDSLAELFAEEWLTLRAQLLGLQGRADEAVALWLEIATRFADNLRLLFLVQNNLLRLGRPTEAAAVVRMIDKELGEKSATPRAYSSTDGAVVHAHLYYALGKWAEGIKWYQRALEISNSAAVMLPVLTENAWQAGTPPREIIKLIDTVEKADKRSLLWRALMLQEAGDTHEARTLLRSITKGKASELEVEDEIIWALAHLMLGDSTRAGLAALLAMQSDQGRQTNWIVYAATGIGSALHGDARAARLNMVLATEAFRRQAWEATLLPPSWRYFATRILSAEQFALVEAYFQPIRARVDEA